MRGGPPGGLGISRRLCYEMARTGRLPVVRSGRRMVIPRAGLEAMLAAHGGGTSE